VKTKNPFVDSEKVVVDVGSKKEWRRSAISFRAQVLFQPLPPSSSQEEMDSKVKAVLFTWDDGGQEAL